VTLRPTHHPDEWIVVRRQHAGGRKGFCQWEAHARRHDQTYPGHENTPVGCIERQADASAQVLNFLEVVAENVERKFLASKRCHVDVPRNAGRPPKCERGHDSTVQLYPRVLRNAEIRHTPNNRSSSESITLAYNAAPRRAASSWLGNIQRFPDSGQARASA
jgi:hypothetical protein